MPEICGQQHVRTLDVRSIAPKYRFGMIMGAYRALAVGDAMELAVDHDPTCMYYTLKAEHGDTFFSFQYLEEGPETWRVRIAKRGERAA